MISKRMPTVLMATAYTTVLLQSLPTSAAKRCAWRNFFCLCSKNQVEDSSAESDFTEDLSQRDTTQPPTIAWETSCRRPTHLDLPADTRPSEARAVPHLVITIPRLKLGDNPKTISLYKKIVATCRQLITGGRSKTPAPNVPTCQAAKNWHSHIESLIDTAFGAKEAGISERILAVSKLALEAPKTGIFTMPYQWHGLVCIALLRLLNIDTENQAESLSTIICTSKVGNAIINTLQKFAENTETMTVEDAYQSAMTLLLTDTTPVANRYTFRELLTAEYIEESLSQLRGKIESAIGLLKDAQLPINRWIEEEINELEEAIMLGNAIPQIQDGIYLLYQEMKLAPQTEYPELPEKCIEVFELQQRLLDELSKHSFKFASLGSEGAKEIFNFLFELSERTTGGIQELPAEI